MGAQIHPQVANLDMAAESCSTTKRRCMLRQGRQGAGEKHQATPLPAPFFAMSLLQSSIPNRQSAGTHTHTHWSGKAPSLCTKYWHTDGCNDISPQHRQPTKSDAQGYTCHCRLQLQGSRTRTAAGCYTPKPCAARSPTIEQPMPACKPLRAATHNNK